jgi:hypothetical protein
MCAKRTWSGWGDALDASGDVVETPALSHCAR